MANPQHIQWLSEGVEAWNNRRENDPSFRPDFKAAQLNSALIAAGIVDSDRRKDLTNFDLSNADFSNSDLFQIDFTSAKLHNSKFVNSTMYQTRFVKAQGFICDFTGASLERADFSGALLPGSKFNGASLRNATFDGANLCLADLTTADLTETGIWKANLFNLSNNIPYQEIDPPHTHVIDTISDLNNALDDLDRSYSDFQGSDAPTFYFRGEPDDFGEIRPSVFRRSVDRTTFPFREQEADMLTELMTAMPEPFERMGSSFDRLALARHHGLPTRLLDVTRNPLVALFHACRNQDGTVDESHDGIIHIFAVPRPMILPFNDHTVDIVAGFAMLSRDEQDHLLTKPHRA